MMYGQTDYTDSLQEFCMSPAICYAFQAPKKIINVHFFTCKKLL
ncbi:unnamed protein product [Staurois parvus]|uniref:Uncharacterized protein n=1 Tax=Staurois parvus TaxID=386267 RepID=A0ABN9HFE5_9NEOB|nr:unnamed protein product [Staurois parvus]